MIVEDLVQSTLTMDQARIIVVNSLFEDKSDIPEYGLEYIKLQAMMTKGN